MNPNNIMQNYNICDDVLNIIIDYARDHTIDEIIKDMNEKDKWFGELFLKFEGYKLYSPNCITEYYHDIKNMVLKYNLGGCNIVVFVNKLNTMFYPLHLVIYKQGNDLVIKDPTYKCLNMILKNIKSIKVTPLKK